MEEKKDLDTVTRRVASIANHLISSHLAPSSGELVLCNTSSSSSSSRNDDSYQRVHGDVPSHDVVWKIASDDSGKDFTDILYEKAVGEGIAKVHFLLLFLSTFSCFAFQNFEVLIVAFGKFCRLPLIDQREGMPSDPIRLRSLFVLSMMPGMIALLGSSF